MNKRSSLPDILTGESSKLTADYLRKNGAVIPDNVRTVYEDALSDCGDLKKLIVPDETYISPGACKFLTELDEPVFNVSRTKLYRFPDRYTDDEYTVPDGVESICDRAFSNRDLRRVVIPGSVKNIEYSAFRACMKLKKVVIKGEDTEIAGGAFNYCNRGLSIEAPFPVAADSHFIYDLSFIYPEEFGAIPLSHTSDSVFRKLCAGCSKGDADKIWDMAEYFTGRSRQNTDFWELAANFWRYRAATYGSEKAIRWLGEWENEHPGEHLPSVLTEKTFGNLNGPLMKSLGFLFFTSKDYYVSKPDENGIVEAQLFRSSERVDFDEYEYYYDWFFLNEHLSPIDGVPPILNVADDDKDCSPHKERFEAMHARAAAILSGKEVTPLPAEHEPKPVKPCEEHGASKRTEPARQRPERHEYDISDTCASDRKPSQGGLKRLIKWITDPDD